MRWMRCVPLAALLLASGPGFATMWRCGNVYQDRPCDAGEAGQKLLKNGRPAPVPTPAGAVKPAAPVASRPSPRPTPVADGKGGHWSCPDLRRRHANNEALLLKGGSAAMQQTLRTERKEIDRELGVNGC